MRRFSGPALMGRALGVVAVAGLFVVVATCRASQAYAAPSDACEAKVRVQSGESFSQISQHCYGSRAYADWLEAHNHRGRKPLRANDTLEIPAFEVLVHERVNPKWKGEVPAIASAFEHFRKVETEIHSQLRAAQPGVAGYHPSTRGKAELDKAIHALRPLVDRLKARGVRTQKFAQALDRLTSLAKGKGSFSTDYAVEDLHQCFSYGVDALH